MMRNGLSRRISVAPMMDCTDRHYRFFVRLMTQHTLLYTEMLTAHAVLYGDRAYLLGFSPQESPVALQLGGSNPCALAEAAKIGEDYGYHEINLNVGCPSDRVQAGRFGVCLMKEPALVAECVAAMQQVVRIPVTVKTRLGVDDYDDQAFLYQFIETVSQAGCVTFIVHARKAWLQGLSPRENRDIPPLCYERVYQLKKDYPALEIIMNGGIKTHEEVAAHLQYVDGVMIGREAYAHPYFLATVDQKFFDSPAPPIDPVTLVRQYQIYVAEQVALGVPLRSLTRYLVGLFKGTAGARAWRRYLSEQTEATTLGAQVLEHALAHVMQEHA